MLPIPKASLRPPERLARGATNIFTSHRLPSIAFEIPPSVHPHPVTMFAARQATNSVFRGVQRRAFSQTAANVSTEPQAHPV